MAIDNAVVYILALALPVWLVVEELMHRDRRENVKSARRAAPAATAVPVSRAA
jgi:hypothetical protein